MNLFSCQIFKPSCLIYLFLVILLFSKGKTQAQILSENAKFKHLTHDDGLSGDNVTAILQDKEGFMWLGTSDGLNKYDGYKFTIYRNDPSDTNSIGPGTIIYSIYQDREGLIWVGAEGSLSVLDKKTGKFKVYKNDSKNAKSLSNNIVTGIFEDKDGNMWISTYGGGLNKFDKKTGDFFAYKNNPKNSNSISSDYIEKCFEDSEGIIWISMFATTAIPKGGLSCFDKKSGDFIYYSAEALNKNAGFGQLLICIKEDAKGIIWNGTYVDGLIAFDKEKKTFINQYKNDPKDNFSLSNNFIQCLYDDSKGNLWVGTFNGLNILDKHTGKFTVFKNDPNNPNSLSNNSIGNIYKDNQGLIWVCTGGGVNIYDPNYNNFIVFKNDPKNEKSLTGNIVGSIYKDSIGNIWMGTNKGGLTSFNKTTGEFHHFKGEIVHLGKKISIPYISSIQAIKEDHLWLGIGSMPIIGFDQLTHKYDFLPPFKNKEGVIQNPVFIFNLLADSKKTLWAANPAGLANINFSEKKIITYKNDPENPTSISENYTNYLFEDSEKNIWASTRSTGLNVFERATGKFYSFKNDPKNPNTINNDIVNIIYQAPNGVLWIGTNGGGLNALILQDGKNKFTSGYKFYHFTEKDGLPNNVIAGILPDDNGSLWISTNNGLCKFYSSNYLALTVKDYLTRVLSDIQKKDTIKKDLAIFKNYDINDGLPSNSFYDRAVCKTNEGLMYFGSAGGLLRFHPDSIKDNMHKPPVYFTSFKIFEKEFPLDTLIATKREIIISYEQSSFSFEFVALDYSQPLKIQYAFMMQGFENKWNYVDKRRFASYTNLDPGEYIFRVKAANSSGVWNEEGASIRIIITPPFWRTNIFYILCILIVSLIVFGYIKWRERKLNEEKRILEDQVTMRTKELTDANSEIVQKNHEITDSINYAKRIQQAILPDKKEIYSALPQSFVLYKPKDIVSGDFYFFNKTITQISKDDYTDNVNKHIGISANQIISIAAADCTGHGVPGAFMSMIGSEKLHDAVQQSKIPGEILMLINKGIKTTLHQSQNDNSTRDGMDIAFCTLDLLNNKVLYSGANRPFLLIRKGSLEIEEIKATKNAIGGFTENDQPFETHEIQLKPGDTFYIFTDGYADQFGGEKGKKFTTKKFKKLLVEIQNKSMQEQEKLLSDVMDAWSLNTEQVDDILVIGIRI